MKTEPIIWKTQHFDLKCILCGEQQADTLVIIDNFHLPLCPDCKRKTEAEIMQAIKKEGSKLIIN